ncbi:MAG: cryptochrome/photolyase family protein [Alphaproteobacteria bacterium]|nr:cryptochrome/photolyase family protein [Alphaproteobacteria bacterium]
MTTLRLVLGDQLSAGISALAGIDPERDVVLMLEVDEECRHVPHHQQKIVLFLSAMRHFAQDLRRQGIQVDYVGLDDRANTGSFTSEIERAIARHGAQRLILTEPGEWRVQAMADGWSHRFGLPVDLRTDDRFFASKARFRAWANGRRSWRMEHFYHEMRREHAILVEGDQPVGGLWNFDAENRKSLPASAIPPPRRRFLPDPTTREVMAMVAERFGGNFGVLGSFAWPVTREEAREALDDFVASALPWFGDYQDAMKEGAPFLYHSLLAPALNLGLLSPREACAAAEAAWRSGRAPINAVEGFIRQILGWREYVRGVYWTLMPAYADGNALEASHDLPAFYWTGETDMQCLRAAIDSTRKHAYAHHIQRLMITGNFALLAGIAPREIERWYLAVYADAIEWVEMPNTLGMAVFADGGRMASKPYAASGAYIDRMSDYCEGCAYDVALKTGPRACPFNYLYWAFLIRNEARLRSNPRMAMPYRTLSTWSPARKAACLAEADAFLAGF